jgi:hypothetical protein
MEDPTMTSPIPLPSPYMPPGDEHSLLLDPYRSRFSLRSLI